MRRLGFTMIELIFVIVIMGILSKFGVEFLAQAYNSYIFSSINNSLQSQSGTAVESIAARLQYRVKDSIIARQPGADLTNFKPLASSDYAETATILEWVATDIEGFRGDSLPKWSGVVDLYNGSTTNTTLKSPDTNSTAADAMIDVLSYGDSGINDAALYFIGSDSDINSYGWNGIALSDHNSSVMHPINSATDDEFTSGIGGDDFNDTDIYEYYQLAWTAYAVEHNTSNGDLTLYYDYQPWNGQNYKADGKPALLMENVDTFRFKAVGSVVKIQLCINTDIVEDYSLCKEKTIY